MKIIVRRPAKEEVTELSKKLNKTKVNKVEGRCCVHNSGIKQISSHAHTHV